MTAKHHLSVPCSSNALLPASWTRWGAAVCGCALWLLVCGCGAEKSKAPDPPRARTRLLLDIFNALEAKDYQTAASKLQKLKDMSPLDLALSNLEAFEFDNLALSQARQALEKGDVDKAGDALSAAIRKRGPVRRLVEAQNELQALREVAKLAAKTRTPEDATDLARMAGKIKTIAAQHPALKDFGPFAEDRLAKARVLLEKENKRAMDDLCADLDIAWTLGASEVGTLAAAAAAEDPAHPESLLHQTLLAKEWAKESAKIPDSAAKDVAIFRMAAHAGGVDRSAFYVKIRTSPPGDYRSLLAKATFLALSDPRSSCALEKVADAAALWQIKPSNWLSRPYPAAKGKLAQVNPLVFYPFYVYIPSFASKQFQPLK